MTKKNYHYSPKKVSRAFWLPQYKDLKLHTDVINVKTFKTVQVGITGWITVVPLTTQHELDRKIFEIKYYMKKKMREQNNHPLFEKQILVDVGTTTNINYRKPYQFFSLETTHFVKPEMVFNKTIVINLLLPFYQEVIDEILIENNDVFKITRSARMDAQKDVAKQNKLERNLL